MSQIAGTLGNASQAAGYSVSWTLYRRCKYIADGQQATADRYIRQWLNMSLSSDGKHLKLSVGNRFRIMPRFDHCSIRKTLGDFFTVSSPSALM